MDIVAEISSREREVRRNLFNLPYDYSPEEIERIVFAAIHTTDVFVSTSAKVFLKYLDGGTIKARKLGEQGLHHYGNLQLMKTDKTIVGVPFEGVRFQDLNTLFANRLATQLGVPSANAWIADQGFIITDFFADSMEGISTVATTKKLDEKAIRQIIRGNLLRIILGQSDTVRENNLATRHGFVPIDLDGMSISRNFNAASIFRWIGSGLGCDDFDDVFNEKFCEHTIQQFRDFSKNGCDVATYLPIIRDEYTELLQKLFLIDGDDLETMTATSVTFKDCSGATFSLICYDRRKKNFKTTVQLIQTNLFVQAFAQGNLHIILGLPKEREEILQARFKIDGDKINELFAIAKDKHRFYGHYHEYCDKLMAVKESDSFKAFSYFLSGIKTLGQTTDFRSNGELFAATAPLLMDSLIKGRTNQESLENFSANIKGRTAEMVQSM